MHHRTKLFAATSGLTVAAGAAVAQPYGPGSGWGMMGGYGSYGYGLLHMVVGTAILAAVVVFAIWIVRWLGASNLNPVVSHRRPAGLDVLDTRYAQGEIDREDYLQRKKDLGA